MRAFLIFVLFSIFVLSEINSQEQNNGLDVTFSLIHPVKRSLNENKYSVDPTLEVLYLYTLSEKFSISSGLFVQAGKHNWEQLTAHAFWNGWMWWPGRAEYSRQLDYFCMGIPLKLEKKIHQLSV